MYIYIYLKASNKDLWMLLVGILEVDSLAEFQSSGLFSLLENCFWVKPTQRIQRFLQNVFHSPIFQRKAYQHPPKRFHLWWVFSSTGGATGALRFTHGEPGAGDTTIWPTCKTGWWWCFHLLFFLLLPTPM